MSRWHSIIIAVATLVPVCPALGQVGGHVVGIGGLSSRSVGLRLTNGRHADWRGGDLAQAGASMWGSIAVLPASRNSLRSALATDHIPSAPVIIAPDPINGDKGGIRGNKVPGAAGHLPAQASLTPSSPGTGLALASAVGGKAHSTLHEGGPEAVAASSPSEAATSVAGERPAIHGAAGAATEQQHSSAGWQVLPLTMPFQTISDVTLYRLSLKWSYCLRTGIRRCKEGDYLNAASYLNLARLISPGKAEPVLGLIVSRVGTADYNQAGTLVGQVVRDWPDVFMQRGPLNIFYGDPESAHAHLKMLRDVIAGQDRDNINVRLVTAFYQWFFGDKQIAAANIRMVSGAIRGDSPASALATVIEDALRSGVIELLAAADNYEARSDISAVSAVKSLVYRAERGGMGIIAHDQRQMVEEAAKSTEEIADLINAIRMNGNHDK